MKEHNVFTEHVREIIAGDAIDVDAVIVKLKSDLVAQLKKRGLAPSALEYAGDSWNDDSLTDIAYDCYAYAFIGLAGTLGRQRAYLEEKVKSGMAIEGLVREKIRWFVQELHQKKYPSGNGVYKNLKSAIERLISESNDTVRLLIGDKVNNECVVSCEGGQDEPISIDDLGEFVLSSEKWTEAIKVAAKVSENAKNRSKLAVAATVEAEKVPFAFRDLNTVVSAQVKDHDGLDAETDWEFSESGAEKIRTEKFNNCYELSESREQMVADVKAAINSLPKKGPKTKTQLCLIFETFIELRTETNGKVKQVDVRKKLGIARSTFSDYIKILDAVFEPILQDYQSAQ